MPRFYVEKRANGRWGVYDSHSMRRGARSSHETKESAEYYRDVYNVLHEDRSGVRSWARR